MSKALNVLHYLFTSLHQHPRLLFKSRRLFIKVLALDFSTEAAKDNDTIRRRHLDRAMTDTARRETI